MENRKLKTFENYGVEPSNDDINEKIKIIISNILKTQHYFMLLKDTTENVVDMFMNQLPKNSDSFVGTVYNKDEMLGDLLDETISLVQSFTIFDDLDELNSNLEKIRKYTERNMDNILSGVNNVITINDDDDEDFEEEEDDVDFDDDFEDDSNDQHNLEMGPKELKRKNKIEPIKESKKNIDKKIHDFLKKHKKIDNDDNLKKGDVVYISGLSTDFGKKLNGRKMIIISKNSDDDECYDLYDPLISNNDKIANIKKMPSKYIFKNIDDVNMISKVRRKK